MKHKSTTETHRDSLKNTTNFPMHKQDRKKPDFLFFKPVFLWIIYSIDLFVNMYNNKQHNVGDRLFIVM